MITFLKFALNKNVLNLPLLMSEKILANSITLFEFHAR
jgi:hypothetical protein